MSHHAEDTSTAHNLRAGGWILADMGLNIWAISIVKALGAEYPSWQIVFLRASVGFVLLVPWILRRHRDFAAVPNIKLQLTRVGLSALTLTSSFFAITQLPLAFFMTMNFTRPLLLMAMAAVLLGEKIQRARWLAGAIGLVGVVVAVNPQNVPWSWGLLAVTVTVVSGTAAIIATRQLKGTPPVVMMAFYTAGIGLLTLFPALATWQAVDRTHLPYLLMIGVLAQCAQFCFLKAHWLGEAGFLAPIGYLSLVISAAVGYLAFSEIPTFNTVVGAVLIVVAMLFLNRNPKSTNGSVPRF